VWGVWTGSSRLRLEGEGESPHGKPRRRWKDIKVGLYEVESKAWTGFLWLWVGTGDGYL
jgi:hypothetical protein